MSVWGDIRKKSLGIENRLENSVYFRITERPGITHIFNTGDRMTFNGGTVNECVGEFVTNSRYGGLVFKLVKGNKKCVENGVFLYSSELHFEVTIVEPING